MFVQNSISLSRSRPSLATPGQVRSFFLSSSFLGHLVQGRMTPSRENNNFSYFLKILGLHPKDFNLTSQS